MSTLPYTSDVAGKYNISKGKKVIRKESSRRPSSFHLTGRPPRSTAGSSRVKQRGIKAFLPAHDRWSWEDDVRSSVEGVNTGKISETGSQLLWRRSWRALVNFASHEANYLQMVTNCWWRVGKLFSFWRLRCVHLLQRLKDSYSVGEHSVRQQESVEEVDRQEPQVC